MAISRRAFLERVGRAGGYSAGFLTMTGLGWPQDQFNNQWCYAHLTHPDTEWVLTQPTVGVTLDQAYAETLGGACNAFVLAVR